MTPPRPADANKLKKDREQTLDDINRAARFLTGPQQRNLNANLRKLVEKIRRVREEDAKRSR
jgi:hypothetical protein